MVRKYSRFLIFLVLYSLILYMLYAFLKAYIPINYQYSNVKFILIFYTLITAIFHFGALSSDKKSSSSFMRFYVAGTTFKLLLLMGFMIIYALMNPNDAIVFIIYFFIGYLLYTAFETTIIYKFMKP